MSRPLDDPVRLGPLPLRLGECQSLAFEVRRDGVTDAAFVVRWRGALHAFVNRCRHLSLPLDFGDGRFFDDDADALVCCHHGARYRPDDGTCVAGPCVGKALTRLELEERDGALWCVAVT